MVFFAMSTTEFAVLRLAANVDITHEPLISSNNILPRIPGLDGIWACRMEVNKRKVENVTFSLMTQMSFQAHIVDVHCTMYVEFAVLGIKAWVRDWEVM